MTYALTPAAAAKAAALRALLAELSLTADQAHALLLAEDVALQAEEDGTDARTVVEAWAEDGREAWADVLREVATFLAD